MANKTFNTRVKNKRDTAANWEAVATTFQPLDGELIIVDTAAGKTRFKVGRYDTAKGRLLYYNEIPFTDEYLYNDLNESQGKIYDKLKGIDDKSIIEMTLEPAGGNGATELYRVGLWQFPQSGFYKIKFSVPATSATLFQVFARETGEDGTTNEDFSTSQLKIYAGLGGDAQTPYIFVLADYLDNDSFTSYHVQFLNVGKNLGQVYINTYDKSTQKWSYVCQQVVKANKVSNALTLTKGDTTTKFDGSTAQTVEIPTKTSELTNDSNFTTQTDLDNLTNTVVSYNAQENITDEQKATARTNIGAISSSEVSSNYLSLDDTQELTEIQQYALRDKLDYINNLKVLSSLVEATEQCKKGSGHVLVIQDGAHSDGDIIPNIAGDAYPLLLIPARVRGTTQTFHGIDAYGNNYSCSFLYPSYKFSVTKYSMDQQTMNADPTEDMQIATKKYVDSAVGPTKFDIVLTLDTSKNKYVPTQTWDEIKAALEKSTDVKDYNLIVDGVYWSIERFVPDIASSIPGLYLQARNTYNYKTTTNPNNDEIVTLYKVTTIDYEIGQNINKVTSTDGAVTPYVENYVNIRKDDTGAFSCFPIHAIEYLFKRDLNIIPTLLYDTVYSLDGIEMTNNDISVAYFSAVSNSIYRRFKITKSTNDAADTVTIDKEIILLDKSDVLTKTNETAFTPTADYQPATKKYVDDNKTTITVDDALSDTSTNPVQNKVVKAAIDNKTEDFKIVATLDSSNNITLDKTYDEIKAAVEADKNVYIWQTNNKYCYIASINNNIVFGSELISSTNTYDSITGVYIIVNNTSVRVSEILVPSLQYIENQIEGIPLPDAELSTTSENPVQNKVITTEIQAINNKLSGLTGAMHFIGKAAVDITDGSTTDPQIANYTTKEKGDVILGKDDHKEFVWNGATWEELGDEGSYALKTTTINGKALSGNITLTAADVGAASASTIETMQAAIDSKPSAADAVYTATAASTDGVAYTATVSGIDSLTVGASFIMIPNKASTSKAPTLNVNGLGAKPIRRRLSSLTTSLQQGYSTNWIALNKPFTVVYDGTAWVIEGLTKTDGADVYGAVAQATADAKGNNIADTYATIAMLQSLLPKVTTITLTSNWVGDASPYYQDIALSCVTETSIVDLQPTPEQLNSWQDDGIAFTTLSGNGTVRVYVAGGKPSSAISVQVRVQEVTVI